MAVDQLRSASVRRRGTDELWLALVKALGNKLNGQPEELRSRKAAKEEKAAEEIKAAEEVEAAEEEEAAEEKEEAEKEEILGRFRVDGAGGAARALAEAGANQGLGNRPRLTSNGAHSFRGIEEIRAEQSRTG